MEEIYGCNLINTKHDRRDVTEFVGKYHIHVLVRQGQMSFSDGKNSFTSRQGDLAIWQMSNTIQCIECSEDFEADVLLLSWQFKRPDDRLGFDKSLERCKKLLVLTPKVY